MRKKSFFYSSFLKFSGFWAKNFSDFWPKNVKNLSKLPSTCPEEQFVAWIFLKFWIVSDFPIFCRNHWHGSKNSIYVSRLKIAEKTVFLCFLFRIVSTFERKFFRLLANYSKICQNYLLRVQRNNLWLEKIFKSFESLWIFCRNIWHGSQVSV